MAGKLTLELEGDTVRLIVRCASHYDAILFYDKINQELIETGNVEIECTGATLATDT